MTDKQYPTLPMQRAQFNTGGGWMVPTDFFTEAQMRAYVDADRARRVPLSDGAIEQATGAKRGTPTFLVARAFCRAVEAAHGIHERKERGDV